MKNLTTFFTLGAMVSIIITAAGMMIYNSAYSSIENSITAMSTQEIEAFNSNFESLEGEQTGVMISSLITRLVANAKTYEEEIEKIPTVTIKDQIDKDDSSVNKKVKVAEDGEIEDYLDDLKEIKSKIEAKHTYSVELEYDKVTGLINNIIIYYEK